MELRLLIVVMGVAIVAYVAWDSFRRRRRNQYSFKLEKESSTESPRKHHDREGFDALGIGKTRVRRYGETDELASDPVPDTSQLEPAMASLFTHNISAQESDTSHPVIPDLLTDEVGPARTISTTTLAPATVRTPRHDDPTVIAITVLGRGGRYFSGTDLSRCFMEQDLRFGERKVFYRYEQASAQGSIAFYVANALNPGTFEMDRIEHLNTLGISLFLTLPGPQQPRAAYQAMMETAHYIAHNLKGDVLDAQRKPLGEEIKAHHEALIRRFEQKQSIGL